MPTAVMPQLIYVVRLWSSDSSTETAWRSTVQNPITGERHVFANLEEFFAFIEETTRAATKAEWAAADTDSAQ